MYLVEKTVVAAINIPVAEMRDHLLLGSGFADDGAQDTMLEHYLRSAIAAVEARTGKVLMSKQYTWSLTAWRDRNCQGLPLAPLSSIDEVRMLDGLGVSTIFPATDYRLIMDDHRPSLEGLGMLLPSIGNGGGVEIDFTAGFGPAWADVPDALRQAVLMLSAHFYENRAAAGKLGEFPIGVSSLIESYRHVRVFGGYAR